jgi:hypothetical protein
MIQEKGHAMDGRIRGAGSLVLLGLAVEAVTLAWSGPTSFLVFMVAGAALIGLGIVYYLISLVTV